MIYNHFIRRKRLLFRLKRLLVIIPGLIAQRLQNHFNNLISRTLNNTYEEKRARLDNHPNIVISISCVIEQSGFSYDCITHIVLDIASFVGSRY